MSGSFYRAFEDRYRGSRELIKHRQEVYLPFIQPLKELYSECSVLDIGCGRGEWLELLMESGFQARGIDLDEGMLEACHILELPAKQGEALATLKALPENSQAVVSGFHIAEHIPFPILQDIFAEVVRVLKPAGLLILETPNAENIVVGTNNFYLDPTHERPIPHLLLSFLAEYSGFARTKLLRLQENLEEELGSIGLKSVLTGVSQDYAVIAQKAGEAESLSLFDPVFAEEYGVSLDFLAQQYDVQIKETIQSIEGRLDEGLERDLSIHEKLKQLQDNSSRLTEEIQAKVSSSTLNDQLMLIEKRLEEARVVSQQLLKETRAVNEAHLHEIKNFNKTLQCEFKNINQKNQLLEDMQQQLNASLSNAHTWYLRATALEEQVKALHASTSWRITAPMRLATHVSRMFAREPTVAVRQATLKVKIAVYPWLLKAMRKVARNPKYKHKALEILQRYPRIYARLLNIAYKEGMAGSAAPDIQSNVVAHPYNPNSFIQGTEPELSDLSLSAQNYYQNLKTAIQAQHKEPR
ncbi:O-antigen chain-terminating methyltransferase [Pseudomonas duriflava]|uniref:O-antigen chain-terminating methyltransferase n=1 Tax=Pseudomonas duriflava TaxID=459528 RepID=A0A562QIE5_9PSED|nr:class I SAM-dependent methyltransferase [Pseudomonas duriflava]TWI56485.1 O-antigen chain-terminating methyltransferase [Pseudomonas duriflava]